MAHVTVNAYARARGVDHKAVLYQINRGVIERLPNGLIDTDQADRAWTPFKSKRQRNPAADRRRTLAEVTTQSVKYNFAKARLERLQAKYVERSAATATILADIDLCLEMLGTAPERYADALAAELEIEPAIARAILKDLIDVSLAELGDVRGDAKRAMERL
jgi:hypothetical protein